VSHGMNVGAARLRQPRRKTALIARFAKALTGMDCPRRGCLPTKATLLHQDS
jgi:hypothetical protein